MKICSAGMNRSDSHTFGFAVFEKVNYPAIRIYLVTE